MQSFWRWLSYWMPTTLVYFCTIRLIAHATTGKWSNQVVPELTAMGALERWHYKNATDNKDE